MFLSHVHLNSLCLFCRITMNNLWRDSVNESIERDFIRRCRQIHNEFEIQKNDVADNLVAELNDRKKAIEQDSFNIELCRYFYHAYVSIF